MKRCLPISILLLAELTAFVLCFGQSLQTKNSASLSPVADLAWSDSVDDDNLEDVSIYAASGIPSSGVLALSDKPLFIVGQVTAQRFLFKVLAGSRLADKSTGPPLV